MSDPSDRYLVSQAAYARLRGVSRSAVRQFVQTGRIPLHDDPDGGLPKVDVDEADRLTGWGSTPSTSPDELPALHESQRKAAHYDALRKQAEYHLRAGQLCEAEGVQAAAFAEARRVRDALERIPSRVAQLVAPETDPRKIVALLETEIRRVLEGLADEIGDELMESES